MASSSGTTNSQSGGIERKESIVSDSFLVKPDANWRRLENPAGQVDQNFSRRVNDSVGVLQERPLQQQRSKKGAALGGPVAGREDRARQFTVANVGNNGMIYLRPLHKVHPQPLSQTPLPITGARNRFLDQNLDNVVDARARDSVRTQTSTSLRNGSNADASLPGARARRSFSASTADGHAPIEQLDAGTLRIIIDRTERASKQEDLPAGDYPSIEVPIPHYRLGTPRFSARGTAFLHQSVYTRSSANGDGGEQDTSLRLNEERLFPKPPGIEAHAVLSRRNSHASSQPYSIQTSLSNLNIAQNAISNSDRASVAHEFSPRIFDMLAADPNDPAIVKYSPISGDIIAATPARIIAQVTSENFLDYELLSDFFLTVRAYLPTHDLLSLLLARFEWAINRFDDNGRVIRVRAFAALRHWILNYFSYDFVVDRELRVMFCDRLNSLTRLVKGRANYGASDMKLIADLKKCWNGRCSLFWDNLPLAGETHQDIDLQPGGVVGSRHSQLVNQSQLRFRPIAPQPGVNPAQLTAGSTSIANWYSAVMEHGERQAYGHHRQTSSTTSKSLPISPSSEHSVPILSCSIPSKGFKSSSPYANKALGIHPVPSAATGRRACPAAPSSWSNECARPVENHRRSGSFSDATRDQRAPLSSETPGTVDNAIQDVSFSDRSLLRGHYLPPGGPYVSAVASTPAVESTNRTTNSHRSTISGHHIGRNQSTSSGPAVKSLFGNIRRALSSKHGAATSTLPHGNPLNAPILQPLSPSLGKSASVPLNVMFQATSSGQLESYRSVRVDLLAAEIFDSFRQATSAQDSRDHPFRRSDGSAIDRSKPQNGNRTTSSGFTDNRNDGLQPPELHRLNSAMTDSSQSILIVDDTGLNMSGVRSLISDPRSDIEPLPAVDRVIERRSTPTVSNQPEASTSASPIETAEDKKIRQSEERLSDISTPRQSHVKHRSVHRHSQRSIQLNRTSLRRYASYQSTFTKRSARKSFESGSVLLPSEVKTYGTDHVPTRMLRRRPGGDLRANQKVQDLGTITRPRSAGSMTTYTDSMRGSDVLGFGRKIAGTFSTRKPSREQPDPSAEAAVSALIKKQSFVHTHSSQPEKRRPSFEAAVAQFAHIPDDDEGGIEATLLKLEGRYKSPVQSPIPHVFPNLDSPGSATKSPLFNSSDLAMATAAHVALVGKSAPQSPMADSTRSIMNEQRSTHLSEPREHLVSTLYAGSDDSYNSVPLLERDAEDKHEHISGRLPTQQASIFGRKNIDAENHMSFGEIIQETPSLRRLRHGSVAPTVTTDSFLLDENDEFLSETSSELSTETVEAEQDHWSIPSSRLTHEEIVLVGQQGPPSPPMTMDNLASIMTQTEQLHGEQRQRPPTPEASPTERHAEPNSGTEKSSTRVPAHPRHMPFILGCDSELLAQQFTLVEQDALKEVDWRDLVDMRWQNTATSTTNWVEYLLTQDPLGIDLATARFNIMVKWALSEIVLTENVEERALTIMKYIHVAQQSRKLNNYATLLQFTIALTSADCTRLSKTWNLVPDKEKEILQDLEMLVSPRRNFHNLRVEMEKANADQGCIPVVALYVHDLTYNAQKPFQLSGTATGEPLVNFERYRRTAVIVKSLLRLIDASTKYDFQPVEGVIERCIWMACLTDEMITHTSKQQEYGST